MDLQLGGKRANGWGRIVNVSGLAARQTGNAVGSMHNIAVAALTKNLADEGGRSGINVSVVHPGLTRTERGAYLSPLRTCTRPTAPPSRCGPAPARRSGCCLR